MGSVNISLKVRNPYTSKSVIPEYFKHKSKSIGQQDVFEKRESAYFRNLLDMISLPAFEVQQMTIDHQNSRSPRLINKKIYYSNSKKNCSIDSTKVCYSLILTPLV